MALSSYGRLRLRSQNDQKGTKYYTLRQNVCQCICNFGRVLAVVLDPTYVAVSVCRQIDFLYIWSILRIVSCKTRKFKMFQALCYYSWVARQLQVATSLGRRHKLVGFQIWDQFWIPQPKLHGTMYLIFFVKHKNGFSASYTKRR